MPTTYRFRFRGIDPRMLRQSIDPAVTITPAAGYPKVFLDITLDPGPAGSSAEIDLKSAMDGMGWVPVATDPAAPLRGITVRQQAFVELASDAQTTQTVFTTLASQNLTVDSDATLNIATRVSVSSNVAVAFRLGLNGVALGSGAFAPAGGGTISLRKRTAVAAGAHTIALQWRLAAAGTANIRPVTQPDAEGASLFVEEIVT